MKWFRDTRLEVEVKTDHPGGHWLNVHYRGRVMFSFMPNEDGSIDLLNLDGKIRKAASRPNHYAQFVVEPE